MIERRLKVPDPLELPWMLGAIVPHVSSGRAVVNELVALALQHAAPALQILRLTPRCFPGFPAIVRALQNLAEPTAGLRGVDPVGVHRRAFQVIHLPAGEVRTINLPVLALSVGGENERAFACANEQSDSTHKKLLTADGADLHGFILGGRDP